MKTLVSLLLFCVLAAPLSANDAVLYYFTADWCGYCQQMKPAVGRLQQDGYPIQVVNRDQHPQMAEQMGVRGLPAFVLVANNQIVDKLEGATSYDRLVQMFRAAKPATSLAPAPTAQANIGPANMAPTSMGGPAVARGQSPEGQPQNPAAAASPASSGADIRAQAMQASVKLKITDADGFSYGSGTVVHTQGNEALVLTCAHLFRDSQGKGPLEVITFQDSPEGTPVPGQLVTYDLERDVALVAIQTQSPIQPMQLASPTLTVEVGQPVFSVGCDHGGPRNLYETRINSINRYAGPDRLQAAGAPAVGRSGGGIFSLDGQLIGVCNFADDEANEGIYAALPTIHAVVQDAQLTNLFQNPASPAAQLASHTVPASNPVQPAPASAMPQGEPPAPLGLDNWGSLADQPAVSQGQPLAAQTAAISAASPAVVGSAGAAGIDSLQGLSELEREMLHYLRGQRGGAEVTVVLRSKDNPGAQPAVFTLPQGPAELVRQAQVSGRETFPSGQVIRGQSR